MIEVYKFLNECHLNHNIDNCPYDEEFDQACHLLILELGTSSTRFKIRTRGKACMKPYSLCSL